MTKAVEKLVQRVERLKLGFDRKAWTRNHLKKKAVCLRCRCKVCAHMMKRHQRTRKVKTSPSL